MALDPHDESMGGQSAGKVEYKHYGHGKSSSLSSSATTTALPYADMIGRAAAKKKQIEASRRGLVILRAVVDNNDNDHNNANPNQDVTNVLQFWVVESRLSLPVQERQWWWGQSQMMSILADCEDTNTSIWTEVWNKLTGSSMRLFLSFRNSA
jgi:hypothetical protein